MRASKKQILGRILENRNRTFQAKRRKETIFLQQRQNSFEANGFSQMQKKD